MLSTFSWAALESTFQSQMEKVEQPCIMPFSDPKEAGKAISLAPIKKIRLSVLSFYSKTDLTSILKTNSRTLRYTFLCLLME